jgi:hypothetical protein
VGGKDREPFQLSFNGSRSQRTELWNATSGQCHRSAPSVLVERRATPRELPNRGGRGQTWQTRRNTVAPGGEFDYATCVGMAKTEIPAHGPRGLAEPLRYST